VGQDTERGNLVRIPFLPDVCERGGFCAVIQEYIFRE